MFNRPGDAHLPEARDHPGGIDALNALGVGFELDRTVQPGGGGAIQLNAPADFMPSLVGRERNSDALSARVVGDP